MQLEWKLACKVNDLANFLASVLAWEIHCTNEKQIIIIVHGGIRIDNGFN